MKVLIYHRRAKRSNVQMQIAKKKMKKKNEATTHADARASKIKAEEKKYENRREKYINKPAVATATKTKVLLERIHFILYLYIYIF